MSKKTRKKTERSRITSKPRPGPAARKTKTTAPAPAKAAAKSRKPVSRSARKTPTAQTARLSVGTLAEGDIVPPFDLPRDGGQSVSVADFAGRKLVIFFYPRADTPGCTLEAGDFSRLTPAFAAAKTAVLGISADPVKAQDKFRDKHQLTIPLASDEQHEVLEQFGVWGEKSMYGKVFMGILRTTVLVNADGRIARIWRNVRVPGHADEVLAAARAL